MAWWSAVVKFRTKKIGQSIKSYMIYHLHTTWSAMELFFLFLSLSVSEWNERNIIGFIWLIQTHTHRIRWLSCELDCHCFLNWNCFVHFHIQTVEQTVGWLFWFIHEHLLRRWLLSQQLDFNGTVEIEYGDLSMK